MKITLLGKNENNGNAYELTMTVSNEDEMALFKKAALYLVSHLVDSQLSEETISKNIPKKTDEEKRHVPFPKGFLYIECPHCGSRRGFCTKEELKTIRCRDCGGEITTDEPLKPLYMRCHNCGFEGAYRTNIKEKLFDITCKECGSPVAVEYNAKKDIYSSI